MFKRYIVSSQLSERKVAILGFHKIGAPPLHGWETWFYIPEETFASQLSYLKENRWQVIDLAAFMRGLKSPESLPERSALLTFDDGYRTMREVALPWLRRFDYPAVLFVPTNYIGGRSLFGLDEEPEEAICDWDDLRELETNGVAVQSHSASHRPFSELNAAEQEEELIKSKSVLEARLNRAVEFFSFPYGDNGTDPELTRCALERAGYRAACLYGGGPEVLPVTDAFQLSRLAMGPDTDLREELAEGVLQHG